MADYQHPISKPFRQPSGASASSMKYDLLSALLAVAAGGEPLPSRLALRISLIITARYNWRRGLFGVAQTELARMWGVSERTAKREMAEMRARGWIILHSPSARGRVAQYRIDFDQILIETRPFWAAIGPDFVERMSAQPEQNQPADNVVPFQPKTTDNPAQSGSCWPKIAERLQAENPSQFAAWFSGLHEIEANDECLTLIAPSKFIAGYVSTHLLGALQSAAHRSGSPVRRIVIEVS